MLVSNVKTASPPLSIARIEVEKLFGRYTYILPDEEPDSQLDSSLLILYGDNGISINTRDGTQIKPEMLSLGEKQLLLLFCNVLTARDRTSIFMIDEPEISLSIKWKRQLIKALLEFAQGSQVQFILTTYSLELLSQYRDHVVKLENQCEQILQASR